MTDRGDSFRFVSLAPGISLDREMTETWLVMVVKVKTIEKVHLRCNTGIHGGVFHGGQLVRVGESRLWGGSMAGRPFGLIYKVPTLGKV